MSDDNVRFGRFRFHLDQRQLFRDDSLVRLGGRALDVLHTLAAAKGDVVSKEELFARVWPGLVVEENNLQVQVSLLRKALETGDECHLVTVPGRGYRLIGLNETPSDPRLPDKPSIAVLPFQNLSDAPDQEYFAEGMVEEIVTALSCIRWLFVIDRNSTAVYKGRTVSVRQIAHELGVRYVLEGAVRRASNRVRITAQLIDADTGANLWAGRFDKHLQDIFQLQDDIAASVAGVIEPTLEAAETRRSVRRPTADLTAYDLYLRARPGVVSGRDKEQVLRALDLLEQAIARDPEYATALSEAAFCRFLVDVNDWTNDRAKNREESLHLAGRALQVSGDDALVLCAVSYVLGYFERDIQPALFLMDRALELNPSFAIGWRGSGWLRLWAGEADIAIKHFERSLRLNPLHRGTATFGIAVAHLFAQRLEMAAGMLQVCLKENPSWVPCHRLLAVCYAHLGRLEDARKLINRLKELTPVLIPNVEHWRLPEQQEFYVTGLRRAIGDVE